MNCFVRNLADGLSVSRAPLTLLVGVAAWQEAWWLALALFGLAWATDLADGWTARRFGSRQQSQPKLDLDGIFDTVLAFGSALVPVVYGWHSYGRVAFWLLAGAFLLAVVMAIAMVATMESASWLAKQLIRWNMIVFHGVILIGGTSAWFVYQAGGWPAVWLAIIGLLIIAALQRRKIGLWWQGRFVPAEI